MQLDIGMVFSSLIGLFLLMGVGWVSVKTKIVPPAASAPMSSLLLKVTLPCTIFSSLATRETIAAASARDRVPLPRKKPYWLTPVRMPAL